MKISIEKEQEAIDLLQELEDTFEVRGYLHPNEIGMLSILRWLINGDTKPEIS